MKKQYPLVLILLTILILGSAFYWYELRPASIKKECYGKANEAKNNLNSTYNGLLQDGVGVAELDFDKYLKDEYEKCLMENGIK
ncbi:MAG: hypothetical protein WC531_01730 [Candidatus Paceibacterota bacterium]|jgi:hypothetical protein